MGNSETFRVVLLYGTVQSPSATEQILSLIHELKKHLLSLFATYSEVEFEIFFFSKMSILDVLHRKLIMNNIGVYMYRPNRPIYHIIKKKLNNL